MTNLKLLVLYINTLKNLTVLMNESCCIELLVLNSNTCNHFTESQQMMNK